MHTLEKLCKVLECTPNDIVKFTEDDESRVSLNGISAFFVLS